MASAQVLSKPAVSSRKKKDLEAGRRLLEEFKKKRGASKKQASSIQPRTDDDTPPTKQTSGYGQASSDNSGNAHTDSSSDAVTGASVYTEHSDKSYVFTRYNGSDSVPHAHIDTQSDNSCSPDLLQKLPKQAGNSHEIPASNYQAGSDFSQQTDDSIGNFGTGTGSGRFADAISSSRPSASQVYNSSDSHSKFYGYDNDFSSSASFANTIGSTNDIAAKVSTEGQVTSVLHQESDSVRSRLDLPESASEFGHSFLKSKNHFGLEERQPSNVVGNLAGYGNQWPSETRSIGFNSNTSSLFNGPSHSVVAEPYPRRSRPSFLDSLNIVKDSSASSRPFVENDKFMNAKVPSSNIAESSAIHDPSTAYAPVEPLSTSVYSNPSDGFFSDVSKGHKSFEHNLESKLEFTSQKQNEDFAALEQHIEDLTQEKFSLQRTLEASKTLTESLAAENSSLTESYNQQASIVSQLKAEMERLQDDIKSRLVELEAIKSEYVNAQLECDAADERAKLLASEVISLEEKALRLRSNELKLERELENSNAEVASYKKKMSSLDRERRDLLQTIDALQEEKKLLQSKLRTASASKISIESSKGHEKKDASTSTNDLGETAGDSSEQASSNMQVVDNADNLLLLQNNLAGHDDFAMSIPPDQMQMIQNINSLISEIISEKEELMQALITEVSTSTKLKELNKELSQKLEVQTQRLELLMSQSMASENIAAKQPTASNVRETVAYADEGDEVVERVLGWIMKLFPGGPSKRRTSRL
ncbi:protein BLISTER-like [Chenopodium quinoa]|uniref:protein BLISTER-like n=1 Tax=Chenopodium quinoa TaxID=63459 RepID=UPI000B7853B8|nr:protein BLISTER-like [Chenopodium quinoa]